MCVTPHCFISCKHVWRTRQWYPLCIGSQCGGTSSTFNPYYLLTCGVHTLPSTPLSTSCSIYISCMWCLSFTFKPFYLLCVIHISYMLCISYAFNPLYLFGALLCLRMLYISFVFIPFIYLPHYLCMWCISFAFIPLFQLGTLSMFRACVV